MRKSLLILLCCAFGYLSAQNIQNRGCATPTLPLNFELAVQQWMQNNTGKLGTGQIQSVYNIPVIVHVIHNNEAVNSLTATTGGNLNAAQIYDQISILNNDFKALNADTILIPNVFKPAQGKFQVNFCLAVVNPTGGVLAEPGINRIDRVAKGWTAPPFTTTYISNTIKPNSIWDPNRYLNMWVCGISGGILGFATFPNPGTSGLLGLAPPYGSATTDGLVMLNSAFGSIGTAVTNAPYHKGRTATHEIGHWMGLRHIWGDGTCATDYCNDTPPAQTNNFGCPTFPYNVGVCTGNTTGEMTMNYMDYTNDLCMYMFTNDQKVRAQLIMTNSPMRAALLTSSVCNTPTVQNEIGIMYISSPTFSQSFNCISAITPSLVLMNYGSNTLSTANFSYNIDGVNTQTLAWMGNVSPNTSLSISMPSVAVSGIGSHTYNVGVYAPNGGVDPYMANNYNNQYFTINSGTFALGVNSASVCNGFSVILTATGALSYTWTGGSNASSIIVSPSVSTNYTVTGSNGSCNISTVSTVSVINLPTVSAQSQTICNGSATLTASGASSYSWSTGSTASTAIVSPSITSNYTVTGYIGSCYSSTLVTVSVTPSLNLNVVFTSNPISPSVCAGGTIQGFVQGGTAPNYTWMPGGSIGNLVTLSPSATVNYTVYASSAGCTGSIIAAPAVSVYPLPTFSISSSNPTTCPSTPVVLTATASPQLNYTWMPGGSTNYSLTVSPANSTTYSITGSNTLGCKSTITFVQNVFPAIILTISPNTSTLCQGSSITWSATGANTYTWLPGLLNGSTAVLNPNNSTTYTIQATGANNCTVQTSRLLGVVPNPTISSSITSASICSGSSVSISGTNACSGTYSVSGGTYSLLTTSSANTVTLPDDAITTSLSIGFPFTFFCNTYNQFYISSNGFILFTNNGNSGVGAQNIPNAAIPNNLIAATWADINPGVGGSITYTTIGTSPNRVLLVTYSAVPHYTSSLNPLFFPVTTQIQLYETSNIIEIHTASKTYTPTAYTMGIENDLGSSAYAVSGRNATTGWTATLEMQRFSPLPSANTSYTWSPGALSGSTQVVSPTVSTVYTLSGNTNGCTGSSTVSVNVNPSPSLTVNSPSICSGSNATLTANGATTYSWNTGSNNSSIVVNPNSTTTYTINGSIGPCTSSLISTVYVNTIPTLNVNSYTLCSGSNITLTVNGASSYSWNTGATVNSIVVSPTASTQYTVTGFNGICTDTKTLSVSVFSTPNLTLSPQSSSICTGSSLSLTANGATSYSWSTGGTSSVIVVSPVLTTQYTVTGITGPCSATAQTQVLVQATPSLSVNSQTVCTGGTATLSVSGANTYSWSTGSSNSFIVVSPSVSTVYTVSGTSNGCSDTQTLSVSVISPPSLTASAISSLICQGSSATLQVSGAGNYTWSSGATGSTAVVSPSTTTMYSVTGSSGLCGSTATVLVQVQAAPVLSVSSASICSGTSASLSVSGASTYSWSTGGTSSVIVVSPVLTTQYTVTGITGPCSATAQTQVLVQATPSLSVNSQTVCPGGTATLSVSGANTYSWSTGSSNSFIVVSPSVSTVYTVSGTSNGCSDTQTLSVSMGSSLSLLASASPSVVCPGGTATLNVSGALSYTWNTGATGSVLVISPTATAVYTVYGFNAGCSGTTALSMSVVPVPSISINASVPGTVCAGAQLSLSATGAGTYSWSTGATGSLLVVSPTVSTVYSVTGSNGACSSTQSIAITVGSGSLSLVVLANPSTICAGASATLNASGAGSYTWNTGQTGPLITVSPSLSTVYTVTAQNGACSGSATLAVQVNAAAPVQVSAWPSDSICSGRQATLSALGSYSVYTWSSSAGTGSQVVVSPSTAVVYTVFASGAPGGCSTSASIALYVLSNPVSVLSITNSGCGTVCTGSIQASTSLGHSPYTYSLSGTTCSTMPCTGLCTGLYTLQTTDSMGCRSNNIFSIAQTNNITGVISSTHATCAQCNDGQLQVNSLSGTAPYTYTWIPSGGNLNTASNLKPGCYTVQVQDAGACKTTLNACIGIRTGIEGELIMPDALLVYPNPAHNWFYAEYPDKNLYITLYDALGRLVVQSQTAYQKAGIDLHHLAKGLYQAHVYIQGVQLVKKIIVE